MPCGEQIECLSGTGQRWLYGREERASLAARIAFAWGALHHDLDSGELATAALLANAGEVELWAIAPELPQRAQDELKSGRASRSESAQRQACGFPFLDITLSLVT